MKIVLTGSSGFLGSILKREFEKSHEVITLGRSTEVDISCDLKLQKPIVPPCDLIVHSAGKAHVLPKTPEEENDFFEVNVQGTQNLLDGITQFPRTFVLISSVAVYGLEAGELIDEDFTPNPITPYGKSKLEAERLVQSWGDSNQVPVLILRLPLVVGENPPGNLGAMIRAMKRGYYRRIGTGSSRKSMVLAQDLAKSIPHWLGKSGIYNLTDGENPSMADLDEYFAKNLGKRVSSISPILLGFLAKIGDMISIFPLNSYRLQKLEQSLTFSDQKARKELNWMPNAVIGNFDLKL